MVVYIYSVLVRYICYFLNIAHNYFFKSTCMGFVHVNMTLDYPAQCSSDIYHWNLWITSHATCDINQVVDFLSSTIYPLAIKPRQNVVVIVPSVCGRTWYCFLWYLRKSEEYSSYKASPNFNEESDYNTECSSDNIDRYQRITSRAKCDTNQVIYFNCT